MWWRVVRSAVRRNPWDGPDLAESGKLAVCERETSSPGFRLAGILGLLTPSWRKSQDVAKVNTAQTGKSEVECSGCGRKFTVRYDISERAVPDLPWSRFTATVFVDIYRVNCPDCGVKREKGRCCRARRRFPRGSRTR